MKAASRQESSPALFAAAQRHTKPSKAFSACLAALAASASASAAAAAVAAAAVGTAMCGGAVAAGLVAARYAHGALPALTGSALSPAMFAPCARSVSA